MPRREGGREGGAARRARVASFEAGVAKDRSTIAVTAGAGGGKAGKQAGRVRAVSPH